MFTPNMTGHETDAMNDDSVLLRMLGTHPVDNHVMTGNPDREPDEPSEISTNGESLIPTAGLDGVPAALRVEVEASTTPMSESAPRGGKKPTPPTAAQLIQLVSKQYRFVKDTLNGGLYAVRDGVATRIREKAFGARMSRMAMEAFGAPADRQTKNAVVDYFEDVAGDAIEDVHMRVAEASDRSVWIDNIGPEGLQVRITGEGYKLHKPGEVKEAPLFHRPAYMKPLPVPENGGHPGMLWQVVNVSDLGQQGLAIAWLVYSLITETRSFPICLLEAENGSAKTTASRIMLDLIDPSSIAASGLPGGTRDLAVMSGNVHVLRFDNISTMTYDWQDKFCRISTGDAFTTRELYSDRDLTVFTIKCPVIMTTISTWDTRPDFGQRVLKITLPRIEAERRLRESEVEDRWNEVRGRVFGALLDLAVRVKQIVGTVDSGARYTPDLPRMADFGMVLAAIDEIYPQCHCMDAYRAQQLQLVHDEAEEEPLLVAMENALCFDRGTWTGTSRELLNALEFQLEQAKARTWKSAPVSPRDVTRVLDRYAQVLRAKGWTIEHSLGTGNDSGSRVWTIKRPGE